MKEKTEITENKLRWGGSRGGGRPVGSTKGKTKTMVVRVDAELVELVKHLNQRHKLGEDLSYLVGHHKNELYWQVVLDDD